MHEPLAPFGDGAGDGGMGMSQSIYGNAGYKIQVLHPVDIDEFGAPSLHKYCIKSCIGIH